MRSLSEVLRSGLNSTERQLVEPEPNWLRFFRHHDYHPAAIEVLVVYADALIAKGIDLSDFELIDSIEGNLSHLETAILVLLKAKRVRTPNAYLIAALRRRWTLSKSKSRP